jgi:membrane protein required for colicin V production
VNWIDLILLGLCAFSLSLGFQKGLIKQVVALGSIVAGILLAGNYHAALAGRVELEAFVKSYGFKAVSIGAYIGIFALTLLIAQGIGHALRSAIHDKPLGQVDSILGALLGAAKVCLVCGVIVLGVFELAPAHAVRGELARSYFAPRLARTVREVFDNLPADYRHGIDAFVQTQKELAAGRGLGAEQPRIAQGERRSARAART